MAHPPAATWRKLGVPPGGRLCLLGAPAAWSAIDAGAGAVATRRTSRPHDVVVAFVGRLGDLRDRADALAATITPAGALWIAWPRKAAGHESDLSDQAVRAALLPLGLVDVKVAMLDEDWSGLKFVGRLERRATTGA